MDFYAVLFITAFAFASLALAAGSTASLRQRLGNGWAWTLVPFVALIWACVLILGFAALAYLNR